MGQRPPFETFTNPTCRGSFALGNACGRCERCEWERAQMFAASEPTPMGMVLGLTTAERQLLLTTSSWLTSLLMGQVSVGQSQGGLLPSDGAGILRTQIEAVRRESGS